LHDLPAPRTVAGDEPLTRQQQRRRRLAGRSAVLASLVAIGAIGWLMGLAVGRVPGQNRFSELQRSPTPTPGATAAGPITIDAGAVQDFDPQGDGSENPTQAQLAVDGDPLTGWNTALYKKRADLGGLKDGVGLLVDLGRPTAVRQVAVSFLRSGADLEIRVADARSERAEDYRVVAKATKAGDVATLTLSGGPVTARYWLVWLTRLPSDEGGFRTAIGEIQLRP
jgi:putative peptidoglycan lipid II flippase